MGILWLTNRTIKYELTARDDAVNTFLRYVYYVPAIYIATFGMLSSLYVRRGEWFDIPKVTKMVLLGISTALSVFILTNSIHYMFLGPKDGAFGNFTYTMMPAYYITFIWIILLTFGSIVTIIVRSRIPNKKQISLYPIAIIAIDIFIVVIRFALPDVWKLISKDATICHSLCIMALVESCLLTGLIPANLLYKKLFDVGPIDLVITDDNYNIIYAQKSVTFTDKDLLKAASRETIHKDQNTLLKGYNLAPGHAVWQEDVSEITSVIAAIQKANEELSRRNEMENKINQAALDIQKAIENNRLYNLSQKATARQNAKLSDVLNQYFSETEVGKRKELLAKAAVLGAYIKRRGNLIFSAEQNGRIATSELILCFAESQRNVDLLGIECFADISLSDRTRISLENAAKIYDLYEYLIEEYLAEIDSVFVHVSETDREITAVHSIGTRNYVSDVVLPMGCKEERENQSIRVSLTLPKGGDRA